MPHRLYILVRNDLPSMNPGRAMAQSAHAANQFIHEYGKCADVIAWQKDANGFGTTICLSANKPEIMEITRSAKKLGACAGLVIDPTYKYSVDYEIAHIINLEMKSTAPPIYQPNGLVILFRKEITCGYIFVLDGVIKHKELIEKLPLHP